jgi:hypothetical protein
MEAFEAILERQLQLTVRTLGQAVRTPSGILVITFYSNIGLGRNQRCLKAKKKLCKLSIGTAINSVRTERFTHPDGPVKKSRITFRTRKTWLVRTVKAPVRTRVPQNPFLTRFWVSKAYK